MTRTQLRRIARHNAPCRFNRVADALRTTPEGDIRVDLVERVRAEIAAGTYDTDEKWEAALDALAGELLGD